MWVSLFILPLSLFAQLLSPEQFLGYKVGTRFTRHHQIVSYFTAIAAAKSDMVKIIPYGKTNEGRDLMVAAIGTPENIKNLEQIRKHNLGLVQGSVQDLNQPGIVWLSYNVHGNEPASSEAAMLTLFALVDPENNETKNWLKNTVVMIDPCINPDGRDRYVNWYNNAVGSTYNTDPAAREHMEPWPAGRTNHYNFDLNRDWAWQTQKETQQRIPLYQSWYPQVHVDFHEQGYNEPYYFAPAAEPLHDVLTPWQKSFQDQIGKNHAKYFDKNNWLFFTKERFDLLYPSYGDTYPMYNGAIGMTYEQGGISAGLGVEDNSYDTVTLVARATHHFTTSLSTIEISSANRTPLLENFKKYFDNSRQGTVSEFKTFIMTAKNASQLEGLASLLKKNNIEYGTLKNADTKFKAFDYYTKKEGDFVNEGYTLAVNVNQEHSVLARVLLEPITQVNDSNTYDITAWALPYAYGVHGYATKQPMAIEPGFNVVAPATATSAYGYLIPYHSFATAKALAQLLKHNVKVRYAEKAFTMNGRNYEIGTLVVLKTSNQDNWSDVTKAVCSSLNIEAVAVNTGYAEKGADFGSPDIPIINQAPRVALLTGEYIAALEGASQTTYEEETPEDTSLGANIGKTVLFRGEIGKLVVSDDGVYGVEIPTEDGSKTIDLYSESLPAKNKDILATTVGVQFMSLVTEPLVNQVVEEQEYKIEYLDKPGNNVSVNGTEYRVNRNNTGQVVSLTYNSNQSKIKNIDARILELTIEERNLREEQKKAAGDVQNDYPKRLATKIANIRTEIQSLNIQRKKLSESNQQRTLRGGNMENVILALNSTPQTFSTGVSTKTGVDEIRDLKEVLF